MGLTGSGIGYDTSANLLYAPDDVNSRVMIFPGYGNGSWTGSGETASDEIGQYNGATTGTLEWTQLGTNNYSMSRGLSSPDQMALDPVNHRLFVADPGNFRIVGYSLNTDNSMNSP